MSFAQFLKDFVESINDFYGSFYGSTEYLQIFKFSFLYLLDSLKFLIKYILTFRWFIDFCFLRVSIPRIMYSSFIDIPIVDNPSLYLFNFFSTPDLIERPFLSGLLNSFLFCIPISANHILLLRRFTVEGLYAGTAAGLGLVVGQLLFLFCIICGFRFIIFPVLSAEFVIYILGLILTLGAVFIISNKPIRRIKITEVRTLIDLFIFHICLTWTEQTTFFSYFSNISFSAEPTLFEMVNSPYSLDAFLDNWLYLSGLMIGSVSLTLSLGGFIYWLGYAICARFNFSYSKWVRLFHYSSLVTLIAFSLTALPYYSFDYITSGQLGFISDDNALRGFHVKTALGDLKKGRLGEYSSHTSLDTDPTPFSRSRYFTGPEIDLTFEDLNYQAEYIWRSRNDRLSLGSPGLINKIIKRFFPNLKAKLSTMRPGFSFKTRIIENFEEPEEPEIVEEESDDEYLDDEDFKKEDIKNLDLYAPIYNAECDLEDFIFRFIEDYQADTDKSIVPDFYHDASEEPFSALTEFSKYGFDSFAFFEDMETDEFEDTLGKRLKRKYYSNWVYKYLLSIDFIDFLFRQPKKYSLKTDEEHLLFNRRLLLSDYYDSLLGYFQTPYHKDYQDIFLGSKSYANKVYNQQFFGTLKIVRKLFSINLNKKQNPKNKSILKYDQPLFKENKDTQNPIIHEEVNNDKNFQDKFKKLTNDNDNLLFFIEARPNPFYAGWDLKSRKFLITNYLSTRSRVNTKIKKIKNPQIPKKSKRRRIRFLEWPLKPVKIEDIKNDLNYHLNLNYSEYLEQTFQLQKDLFEYTDVLDYDNKLVYETLPAFFKRLEIKDKDKSLILLHPLKGGFAWSGNEPLNFELQEKLIKLLDYIPKFKGFKFKLGP